MLKKLSLSFMLFSFSVAYTHDEPTMMHAHSVDVSYTNEAGELVKTTISRDSDLRCRQIPFNAREYWDGDYASRDVADVCKKTFITAAGKLSPMKMHEEIDTYGELEVLEFLEEMQDDSKMLFVDSRKKQW